MRKFLFTVVYFLSPFLLIFTLYNSNPAKYADVRLLMSMVVAKDLSYKGEKGYIDRKCIERLIHDAGVRMWDK